MRCALLIWLTIFFAAHAFGQVPLRDITQINTPLKLRGEWGFADGKALLPEQTQSIEDSIHLPQYLENRQHGAVGVATFVIDLKTTPNKPLSIDFTTLVNAWKLFADDKLVCESGVIDVKNKIYLASPKPKIASFTPTTDKTRLTLWVANSQHRHFGIGASPKIAPAGVFEASHALQANINLATISVTAVAALYHLGLFVVWRRDKAPLWFGLFLAAFAVRIATTSEKIITTTFDSISWNATTCAEYISGYAALSLFILYVGSLYPKQSNKIIEYANVSLGVILILPVLVAPPIFFTAMMPFGELVVIESVLFVAWILYRAFRDKEPHAAFAVMAFAVFSITIFHDVLMFAKILDDTRDWGPIGFIFYLFAQATILLQRYANAFYTVQKNEEELETTIAERIAELKLLLAQRELLMRELSHRVKNNLQFIIALIWNKRVNTDRETQKILLSLESQIQAIATVHEVLCIQPNISSLKGGEHIQTLVDALQTLYPNVDFVCVIGNDGLLSMDDSISLGLIVSELVSNSVKHALLALGGAVQIGFEVQNNTVRLTYCDDRTNFKNNDFIAAAQNSKSLGWSMITKLVQRLKATTSTEGSIFTIEFTGDKTV